MGPIDLLERGAQLHRRCEEEGGKMSCCEKEKKEIKLGTAQEPFSEFSSPLAAEKLPGLAFDLYSVVL